MTLALQILLPALLACLLLTAFLAYLGLHVLAREVIFVDIALAQIAALGQSVAYLMGAEPHDPRMYTWSFGFTLLGAALFSFLWDREHSVLQEAFIGISFALATAATLLLLSNAPHGAEHIRDVLVGQLLAVGPGDVARLAVLYAVIGALHVAWRRRLLLISHDPDAARAQGLNVKLWDFLFYLTFGLTVTASVELGGVLVVFSYLIVPSVTAILFAEHVGTRLAIGWTVAALASALGMLASVWLSAPPGASVVCVFGALLILAAMARPLLPRRA